MIHLIFSLDNSQVDASIEDGFQHFHKHFGSTPFRFGLQEIMDLSRAAQKAIVAYKVIQHIRATPLIDNAEFNNEGAKFSPQNSPESTLKHLNTRILSIRESLLDKRLISQEFVNDSNYDQVMNIFCFQEGLPINKISSKQESITYASDDHRSNTTKRLVFNPSSTTVKLFNFFMKNDRKAIIYGMKGIGKSISTLLFCHLCSIITEFRVRENPSCISEHVDMKTFLRIPKVIYHHTVESFTLMRVIHQIQFQVPQLKYPHENLLKTQENPQKDERVIEIMGDFMRFAEEQYRRKGIELIVVIDEANLYYNLIQELARLYAKKKSNAKMGRMRTLTEQIFKISSYLKVFRQYTANFIFLTNTQVKKDFFSTLKEWEEDMPFNIDEPMNALRVKLHTHVRLSQQYEQIETYLMLWFEIIRKLMKMGRELSQNQTNKLFAYFQEANHVFYINNWLKQREAWATFKCHLSMRQAIEETELTELARCIRYWQSESFKNATEEQRSTYETQICNQFKQIVKSIQDQSQILHNFYKGFYWKQKDPNLKQSKLQYLLAASGSAHKEIKQATKYIFSNRFILIDESKQPETRKDNERVMHSLIKPGLVSLENGVTVVNHSPVAFLAACPFVIEQFDNLLKQKRK